MEQASAKKTAAMKVGDADYRAVLHDNAASLELEVTRDPSGDLYANSWDDSTFNPATVFAQLEAKKFTASFSKVPHFFCITIELLFYYYPFYNCL
jgi:hypothetical protein